MSRPTRIARRAERFGPDSIPRTLSVGPTPTMSSEIAKRIPARIDARERAQQPHRPQVEVRPGHLALLRAEGGEEDPRLVLQDGGDLEHRRDARAVVVRGGAGADAVHVRDHDRAKGAAGARDDVPRLVPVRDREGLDDGGETEGLEAVAHHPGGAPLPLRPRDAWAEGRQLLDEGLGAPAVHDRRLRGRRGGERRHGRDGENEQDASAPHGSQGSAHASSSKKRKTKNAKAAKKTIASDADMITPAICWSASGESPQSRGGLLVEGVDRVRQQGQEQGHRAREHEGREAVGRAAARRQVVRRVVDDRPPEERAGGEVAEVLEVEELVVPKRRVVRRRNVPRVVRERPERERDERVRQRPARP